MKRQRDGCWGEVLCAGEGSGTPAWLLLIWAQASEPFRRYPCSARPSPLRALFSRAPHLFFFFFWDYNLPSCLYNCIWQSLQPCVKRHYFLQERFPFRKLQLQCCLGVAAPAFPCQMAETGGRSDSLWWQDTELCCDSMHLCDTAKILRRRYNLHAHLVIITFQTLVTQ